MRGSARVVWLAGAVITGAIGAPAIAAPASAPAASAPAATAAPPVGNEPASTSATYGDWVLRCQRVGDGAAAKRVCEVAQTVRVPEAREPVAEVALGHLPNDKALHLTTLLPPNVSFPSSVVVSADKATARVELPWRRCLAGGCFADGVATDDIVKLWRAQTTAGRITYKDALGREVGLPVSFRGLAQALDALDKP